MRFPFIKATATGNDFLIADLLSSDNRKLWDANFKGAPRATLAKILCDRHESLGADGLLWLEAESGVTARWDFYNSDGSQAEMCGNAARAVALYLQQKTGEQNLKIKTGAGLVEAQVTLPDDIAVTMTALADERETADYFFVRSGVPHAVITAEDFKNPRDLEAKALSVKSRPEFQKEGVNVTFIRKVGDFHIQSQTHERGVEGFTKSCGTGAVAAAWAFARGRDVIVDVPGGRLRVVFKNGRPVLSGPARIVATMFLNEERVT